MSGLFGIYCADKNITNGNECIISNEMKNRLATWNRAYGDKQISCMADVGLTQSGQVKQECFFGVSEDSFSSCRSGITDENAALIRKDTFTAVSDELIFNIDESWQNIPEFVEENGIEALESVNGEFAAAIYRPYANTLSLIRDHMGVRPLFYYCKEGLIVFSSDIRGISSIDEVDTSVSDDWLYKSLYGYSTVSVINTEYKYIKCVPPGGSVTIDLTNMSITSKLYWKPGSKRIRLKNQAAYCERLRELITDAVKIRADAVKSQGLGAELSGGLDSGVIDILLHRLGYDCRFFSWTPGEDELPLVEHDERLVIYDICKQENIECAFGPMRINMGAESLISERTPVLHSEYDPYEKFSLRLAFPAYINTLPICQTAEYFGRNGIKAVFTGHGGDEGVSHRSNPYELLVYHEYYHYLRLMWSRSYGMKNRLLGTLQNCRENLKIVNEKFKKPFTGVQLSTSILCNEYINQYKGMQMPIQSFAINPKEYIIGGGSRSRLDVVALFGAYNGVRYLAPYLDHRLVDFALGIPRYLYLRAYRNRYIFREAFKDIMPESLYSLKCKQDVSMALYRETKQAEKEKEKVEHPELYKSQRMNIEYRQKLIDKLNRDYWKGYIDFSKLDQWAQNENYGEPSVDEDFFQAIMFCLPVQNMVEKSRLV